MIVDALGEEQEDEMDTDSWIGKKVSGLISAKTDKYGVPRLQIERYREE